MADEVRLMIGDVDYAPYCDTTSLTVSDGVDASSDSLDVVIYLPRSVQRPRSGMGVVWARYDSSTGAETTREFAGVVTEVTERIEGSAKIYEVHAGSFLRWFNRKLVNQYFPQQTAEQRIAQIVSAYCPGFTTNNVKAPIVVPAKNVVYKRPFDTIKEVLDQIGYACYIDYFRDLHVFAYESFVSPLPGGVLDVDNDTTSYGDLELTEDSHNVWNHFTLKGFLIRSKTPFVIRFKGDGTATQFMLGYKPSSAKGDVKVTVGGTVYDVKRDLVDGSPNQGSLPGVAYVHYTQGMLRFAVAPSSGTEIVVSMHVLLPKTRIDTYSESIDMMRELEQDPYSDGVYEWVENDSAVSGSDQEAATAKLQLLALKYGKPLIVGGFTSFLQGWRAGQTFRMVSADRLDGISADSVWYVQEVKKKWIQPMHAGDTPIQYVVSFASRPDWL